MDDAVYRVITQLPQHKKKLALTLALALVSLWAANRRKLIKNPLRFTPPALNEHRKKMVPKRVGVDARFLEQFRRILPICIPGSIDFYLSLFRDYVERGYTVDVLGKLFAK